MKSIHCFRYRNIYTPEGLTLHELALKLQDSLNSNGVSSVDFSDIDDPPNIASSGNMQFISLNKTQWQCAVELSSIHMLYFVGLSFMITVNFPL
jgi:hypothetical protein